VLGVNFCAASPETYLQFPTGVGIMIGNDHHDELMCPKAMLEKAQCALVSSRFGMPPSG